MFKFNGLIDINLDLFDLKRRTESNYFSLYGFTLILLMFIAITRTEKLKSDSCTAALTDLSTVFAKCGITVDILIFNVAYFYISAIVIIVLRDNKWPLDAIFNHVIRLLIATTVLILSLYFLFGMATTIIQHIHTLDNNTYIFILGLSPVLLGLTITGLMRINSKNYMFSEGINFENFFGIIRLSGIYVTLNLGYIYFTYKYMLTD